MLFQAPKAPVVEMAVDASGGLLATGSANGSTRVWDTDGFFCTHAFSGHRSVRTSYIIRSFEILSSSVLSRCAQLDKLEPFPSSDLGALFHHFHAQLRYRSCLQWVGSEGPLPLSAAVAHHSWRGWPHQCLGPGVQVMYSNSQGRG